MIFAVFFRGFFWVKSIKNQYFRPSSQQTQGNTWGSGCSRGGGGPRACNRPKETAKNRAHTKNGKKNREKNRAPYKNAPKTKKKTASPCKPRGTRGEVGVLRGGGAQGPKKPRKKTAVPTKTAKKPRKKTAVPTKTAQKPRKKNAVPTKTAKKPRKKNAKKNRIFDTFS